MALYSVFLKIVVIGILLYPGTISGLGINCRGSRSCSLLYSLNVIADKICNQIPKTNLFSPGQRIATDCKALNGIAAFTQNTDKRLSGEQLCVLIRRLQDHKCRVCGSVPFDESKNDVNLGQLTVNYVGTCVNVP